jgi:type I restriction enzyme, S subunit
MPDDCMANQSALECSSLPAGWVWRKLKDLIEGGRGICYGIVQPGIEAADGISVLRVENVENGRVSPINAIRVDPEVESKYRRSRLIGGEILITLVGAYFGKVALAPPSVRGFNVARAVGVIPVGEDAEYTALALRSPSCQRFIQTRATTTAQPTLNLADVAAIPIPWPSRRERTAIAHILGALDDKIELNRRMNETLEGMARALFKSWFVDFDPVRAKLDGCGPTGLDPATAALFPDHFEHTASGLAPAGWTFGCVRDLCVRVENGGTPKREVAAYWNPPEVPWLTSGEVREGFIVGTANFISREGLDSSSAKIWPAFTTVVALYGATAGYSTLLGIELSANQACCALIPAAGAAGFIFLLASSSLDVFQQQTRGSAQQNLSQSIVAELPTIVPSSQLLAAFDRLVYPLLRKCIENLTSSRTLAALRDALLPKLLSGEIRVPAAEKLVEEVA